MTTLPRQERWPCPAAVGLRLSQQCDRFNARHDFRHPGGFRGHFSVIYLPIRYARALTGAHFFGMDQLAPTRAKARDRCPAPKRCRRRWGGLCNSAAPRAPEK
jgi:hypothetical protein